MSVRGSIVGGAEETTRDSQIDTGSIDTGYSSQAAREIAEVSRASAEAPTAATQPHMGPPPRPRATTTARTADTTLLTAAHARAASTAALTSTLHPRSPLLSPRSPAHSHVGAGACEL